jgi:hypothetical protein
MRQEEFDAGTGKPGEVVAAEAGGLPAEMPPQGDGWKQAIWEFRTEMAAHFLATERKSRLLFEEYIGRRKAIDEGRPDM